MSYENQDTRPMTVGDWMITLLVLALPCVNIVMYLYWALSGTGNVNRQNFCRASIIWFLIVMGFVLVISVFAGMAGLVLSV